MDTKYYRRHARHARDLNITQLQTTPQITQGDWDSIFPTWSILSIGIEDIIYHLLGKLKTACQKRLEYRMNQGHDPEDLMQLFHGILSDFLNPSISAERALTERAIDSYVTDKLDPRDHDEAGRITRDAFEASWKRTVDIVNVFLRSAEMPGFSKKASSIMLLTDALVQMDLSVESHVRSCLLKIMLQEYFHGQKVQQLEVEKLASYPYTVLRPGEVRMLILLPSANIADEIECDLVHRVVEQNRSYSPLSYVWGAYDDETPLVRLCGKPFRVTSNLYSALIALRRPSTKRVIWVDALCINQQDLQERAKQVALMKDIYRNADSVLVWLGESDKDSDIAMQWLSTLCNTGKDSDDNDVEHLFGSESYPKFDSLLRFFRDRAYWKRLWIVQEAVLNPRTLLICGQYAMWWTSLFIHITEAQNVRMNLNVILYDQDLVDVFSITEPFEQPHVARLAKMCRSFVLQSGKTAIPLLQALNISRECEATDPRDNIFGIIGLLTEEDASLIDVTYTKPVATLFRELTITHINRTRSLDILSGCKSLPHVLSVWPEIIKKFERIGSCDIVHELRELETFFTESVPVYKEYVLRLNVGERFVIDVPGSDFQVSVPREMDGEKAFNREANHFKLSCVPSWVPRWNQSTKEHVLDGRQLLSKDYSTSEFSASGDSKVGFHFHIDSRVLHLEGFQFDCIETVVPSTGEPLEDLQNAWKVWETEYAHRSNQPYGDLENQKEIFRRTCEGRATNDDDNFTKSFDIMMGWLTQDMSTGLVLSKLWYDDKMQQGPHPRGRMVEVLRKQEDMLSVFFTKSGRMGLGPSFLAQGDIVTILFGGKIPLVLRASGFDIHGLVSRGDYQHNGGSEYHLMLGECYIQGIMHGEAMEGVKSGEYTVEKFIII